MLESAHDLFSFISSGTPLNLWSLFGNRRSWMLATQLLGRSSWAQSRIPKMTSTCGFGVSSCFYPCSRFEVPTIGRWEVSEKEQE